MNFRLVRRCPKCQSGDIHRSRSQGSDILAILLLLRPYRCLDCWHRYFGLVFARRDAGDVRGVGVNRVKDG